MMYLFQSLVIAAVVIHNEYNHWTPNKLLAGLIGVGLAYLLTRCVLLLRRK